MSKAKDTYTLFLPGENGWDLWSCSTAGSELIRKTSELYALNVDKLPHNKPVLMSFPVKELTALELKVPSDEKESISELVSFQVEKVGLAQGEENGILHQYSEVDPSHEGEQSLYSIDVLRAPKEGTLPEKSPDRFSVSPRCFSFEGDSLTLWKEFGKWVLSITDKKGNLIHYQGLTDSTLGLNVIEDIKFIIGQLMMQGVIQSSPSQYIVWTEEEEVYPEGYESLQDIFSRRLRVEPKPAPTLPPVGSLLPADTRAERLESMRKKRQGLLLTLASLLFIGLLAYAAYALLDLQKRAKMAKQDAQNLIVKNQSLLDHTSKWDELEPVVDTGNSPIQLLLKCQRAIPSKDVNLKRAVFTHQITSSEGRDLRIVLIGTASDLALANKFDENLAKSKDLESFQWSNQQPKKSNSGWDFIFNGAPPITSEP